MKILILSDIHANFAALEAIDQFFSKTTFDLIVNCGDSIVYGPFPNQTLEWLNKRNARSILGNTDKKVIKLLSGKNFKKPSKPEKRIMYTWTAETLSRDNSLYIQSFNKKETVCLESGYRKTDNATTMLIVHGSPQHNHEFLFDWTPLSRYSELAGTTSADIVLCGHSHSPFHKLIDNVHFINPGSVGRMFDHDPRSSCAVLTMTNRSFQVVHYRIDYDIEKTVCAIQHANLPDNYCHMFRTGTKTN